MNRVFRAISTLLFCVLLSVPAQAQDAIELEVIRNGQVGQSNPKMIITTHVAVNSLQVLVSCGNAKGELNGGANPGDRLEIELPTRVGRHTCSGSLQAKFADGSSGDMPLSFDVQMLEPMVIKVPLEQIKPAGGILQVVLNRPAGMVNVQVYGLDGKEVGSGTVNAEGWGAGDAIPIEWSPTTPDILRIQVTAHDVNGFWSRMDLFPWYYEIPHEDIGFETNESTIQETESYKLTDAKKEIDAVLARYQGSGVVANLYVAGYTDRVGSTEINRALSERRAASIARWFQQAGFLGEIWYQGFGEKGNLVSTPDEVEEAKNRRAAYVIAAEAPPVTALMPGSTWMRLR